MGEPLIQRHLRLPFTEMDVGHSTYDSIDEPYRNLWLAVIQRAFEDISSGYKPFETEVLSWLRSDNAEEIFNYLNIEALCKLRIKILNR